MKPAREPASIRPKPCASLKKPHESCPFAAPCGPRRKKNDRGQRSAFSSETFRFALSILAHRGSAFPWLVNDRAALRLRRIWCVPTNNMDGNPVRDHKEVPRSTGHIMVTTRYSDQQRSKSRQKVCDSTNNGTDQYQNGSSNLLTPY